MFEEQLLKFLLHDKFCEQKSLQLLKCKATFLIISIEFFFPNQCGWENKTAFPLNKLSKHTWEATILG